MGKVTASVRGRVALLFVVFGFWLYPLGGAAAQTNIAGVLRTLVFDDQEQVDQGPAFHSDGDVSVATADRLLRRQDRIPALGGDEGVRASVATRDDKAEADSKDDEAASAKSATAEKQKEKAESETDRVKPDTAKAVDDRSKRVDEKTMALKIEREQRKRYMIYGGIAVSALLILSFLLWSTRKRDLRNAEAQVDAANADVNDCLLEGTDAAGGLLTLRVSGRDLMKSANGIIFGGNPDMADVVIADDSVSRRHARFVLRDNRLYLEDLESAGGTRVNGEALDAEGGPSVVATGDVIELGGVKLTLKILER